MRTRQIIVVVVIFLAFIAASLFILLANYGKVPPQIEGDNTLPDHLLEYQGVFSGNSVPSAGSVIPTITGMDLVSNEVVSTESYRGKWILLDFMSSG